MRDKIKSFDLFGIFKFAITLFFFSNLIWITLRNAVTIQSVEMAFSIIVIFFLSLIGLMKEFYQIQNHNKVLATQFSFIEKIKIIIIFTFAAIATYLTAVIFNISTMFSASIVSLLIIYLLPGNLRDFQITVYTGTIAGMVSDQFISEWPLALLFGFIASFFYIFFQSSHHMTGGRAGMISYMVSLIFTFVFPNLKHELAEPIERDIILFIFIFILIFISAFIVYSLKNNNILSVVKAAMLVTLVLNLVIPNNMSVLITAGFIGTIIAMSGPDRVKSLSFLTLVVFFSFLIFIPAHPLLIGINGKVGMVTLIGYLAADGTTALIKLYKFKTKNKIN